MSANEPFEFAVYPLNLFEEPRDHANAWDVSVLWPDRKPEPRETKHSQPAHRRSRRPCDHANMWDVSVLWPDPKPQSVTPADEA